MESDPSGEGGAYIRGTLVNHQGGTWDSEIEWTFPGIQYSFQWEVELCGRNLNNHCSEDLKTFMA